MLNTPGCGCSDGAADMGERRYLGFTAAVAAVHEYVCACAQPLVHTPSEDGEPGVVPQRDLPLEGVDYGVESAARRGNGREGGRGGVCTMIAALPVSGYSAARKHREGLNLSDFIGGGHDLNLLGDCAALHSDHIFIPGRRSKAHDERVGRRTAAITWQGQCQRKASTRRQTAKRDQQGGKADAARLRWSNLAHATTDNEVFQNPEDELLPAGGSSGKQGQAFEHAAYRSCGENRS